MTPFLDWDGCARRQTTPEMAARESEKVVVAADWMLGVFGTAVKAVAAAGDYAEGAV